MIIVLMHWILAYELTIVNTDFRSFFLSKEINNFFVFVLGILSAFYGQCLVTEAWTNPSPWSIKVPKTSEHFMKVSTS